jgi:hypothetical protein
MSHKVVFIRLLSLKGSNFRLAVCTVVWQNRRFVGRNNKPDMEASAAEMQELYANQVIRQQVQEIWGRVFAASNKAIQDAKSYGFLGMEVAPDPNIHTMMVSAKLYAEVMNMLVLEAEHRDDTESVRLLLNAKQQLIRLERLANELKANNEDGFNEILAELKSQAVF